MPDLPNGLYDLLITREVEKHLQNLGSNRRAEDSELEKADAHVMLTRHVADVIRQALLTVPEADRPARQAEICNEIIRSLSSMFRDGDDELVEPPPRRLAAVYPIDALRQKPPTQPHIPLSQSDLLVNARGEPRVGSVLEAEIDSADRIDLIVAFIRWSGLRLIAPKLHTFIGRGGKLRVITSTYTGSTERRAIDQLVSLGAQVKVSYQTDNTRLHAKAWLLHRESGFSTVFIGSSNLSTSAMVDGLEWNVRLSQTDAPTIVEKFSATFESYWAEADFEPYDPTRDATKFDNAIASTTMDTTITFVGIDVEPWPYQQEMLDELTVERYRHDRWRNLIVAATGTGKTVVAALDYRRLTDASEPLPWKPAMRPPSLLFVAHRREILKQSRDMFRQVMRDGSFGELYVDGDRPDRWHHVFASVQSLNNVDLTNVSPTAFDVIIVDEFHHAAAPTYRRLLDHFQPRVLVGLTATPERTDAESILGWFGGRISVELRLWDALDRGLLSPFQYFGIHDNVDIAHVAWKRGRYDETELENLYTGNDARVVQILEQLRQKSSDVRKMRALGFCVGVHHAEFMAARFRAAGIPSEAVLGTTDSEQRDAALKRLKAGEIKCLFAVDIFNEGVDVPQIDTVLFLRPTESSLVFLQQLGRGLRRARDKACLTVLDFIGNASRNFRFDLRYRAITGASRREIQEQVASGFPYLPAGCSIQLDHESSRIVLENLKQSIGATFKSLVNELKLLPPPPRLSSFLENAALEPEDLYRSHRWSWTRLKREAGFESEDQLVADTSNSKADEEKLLNALPRLLHLDDERRLNFLRTLVSNKELPSLDAVSVPQQRILQGFLLMLWGDEELTLGEALRRLWQQRPVRSEIAELLDVLDDRASHLTFALPNDDIPLSEHARYTRDEVLAAIGRSTVAKRFTHREGPLWDQATNTDYFFVTLEKSEKYYSPSTRYRDYAISPDTFHWESQSTTSEQSPTGQRYIHHRERGSKIMLLVRPRNKDANGRSVAFTFLGPASYLEHRGERPISFLWKLDRAMPLDFFSQAKVIAG